MGVFKEAGTSNYMPEAHRKDITDSDLHWQLTWAGLATAACTIGLAELKNLPTRDNTKSFRIKNQPYFGELTKRKIPR